MRQDLRKVHLVLRGQYIHPKTEKCDEELMKFRIASMVPDRPPFGSSETRGLTWVSMSRSSLSLWRSQTFISLNYPAFRLYWISQIISLVGTWLQNTAQSYLVLEMTGSSALLGWVSATFFVPSLLLSVWVGTLLDHLHRGRMLQITQIVLACNALFTGLLLQTGHLSVPLIFVVVFISGCANAFNMPSRQTMAAGFVPKGQLPNALALNNLSFNLSRTAGQALFGVVVPLFSWLFAYASEDLSRLSIPFYWNAVSFAVTLFLQRSLPIEPPKGKGVLDLSRFWNDTKVGLVYVVRHPVIRPTLLLVAVVSTFLINFQVLVPYFAKQVFHLGEMGFGLLNATFGLGSMAGALYQASQSSTLRNLRRASLVLAFALMGLSLSETVVLAAGCLFVCGFCSMVVLISANGTVQLAVQDALRGRVMSVYSTVVIGVSPIGAVLSGFLISKGAHVGTGAMAALGLLCVLALWRQIPREQENKTAIK